MSTDLARATIPETDPPWPDVSIYPVRGNRRRASSAHEEARGQTFAQLRRIVLPPDLVATELGLMWDPHDLRKYLQPDIMVVRGAGIFDAVEGGLRKQFRIWDEGKQPDLVIEFASPSTVGRDLLGKKENYAALGVSEYVQFDPLRELPRDGLRVYRLSGATYRQVRAASDGSIPSSALPEYEWLAINNLLRLRNQVTGLLVPTPEEAIRREAAWRREIRERQQQAEERRQQAEKRERQAEELRQRAEEAQRQAVEALARETAARHTAEEELRRALAELARLRGEDPAGT